MTRTQRLTLALAPLVMVTLCVAAARAVGGDPLLGIEIGLGGLVAAWFALLVSQIRRELAIQQRLEGAAARIRLGRREVRLLDTGAVPRAFVAGPFQPTIFVTRSLIDGLDQEELDAVLLHEEHHLRTRAPLRALALASWLRLVGVLPGMGIGSWIDRRVAHLEIEADRHALARGATVAAIASALIKCDRSVSPAGIGYASAAELRLRALLHLGSRGGGPAAAPLEWLAPAIVGLALGVCHLFLG